MNNQATDDRPRGTRWCSVGTMLGGLGLALVLVGLLLARLGVLAGVQGLMLYGIGSLFLILTTIVAGIGLACSKGSAGAASQRRTWTAFGLAAAFTVLNVVRFVGAAGAPPIHDITTDLSNPPAFAQLIPLRADASNPPDYPGPETADLQRSAYPDIQTMRLSQSADGVLEALERVVEDMGWALADMDLNAGRIEATDTTFWFRFTDDVVIRVTPRGSGTDVDIRSKSRVGVGDMGTNARRIRVFQDRLNAAITG